MMGPIKSYNRFLFSDEKIPRRSKYRYKIKSVSNTTQMREDVQMNQNFNSVGCPLTQSTSGISSSDSTDVSSSITEYSSDFSNCDSDCITDKEDNEFEAETEVQKHSDTILFQHPNEPLYSGASISNLEAFVSLLAFIVRFNLSETCTEELLRLLQIILPPCQIPSTNYLFKKKITADFHQSFEMHLYCPQCKTYISELSSEEKPDICSQCFDPFDSAKCLEKGDFFLYMPLAPQLKIKFEKENLMQEICDYRKRTSVHFEHYRDVMDGDLYQSQSELQNDDNISLQFNVDGIPLYKKSSYSLWPIQCMINELSPSSRNKHILMTGLWFGCDKPLMNQNFLIPFVNELQELSENGLQWHCLNNIVTTRVFVILCSSDAPARAMLQNFKQFNGEYGCGFCNHKGEVVQKWNGHCRVYPFQVNVEERCFEKCVQYAEQAIQFGNPVKGVKGTSLLMNLYPGFDVVKGFVPDFMHAALLGVTRQFTKLWIESTGCNYSLSTDGIRKLDKLISNLKVTQEVTRQLRSTKDICFWKASEWRVFLLASPVLLKNILNSTVYKHWLLFADSINLLLGTNISIDDINKSQIALNKFVSNVSVIYGKNEQTYNVHIILHFPLSVKSWGPLWAHSCFSYEDSSGKLKRLHHGTKCVPLQIIRSYANKSVLRGLLRHKSINNEAVIEFVHDMERGKKLTKKASVSVCGCTLFGKSEIRQLLRVEEVALQKVMNVPISTLKNLTICSYNRLLYSGKLFSTKKYCCSFTRVDYVVEILQTGHHKVVEILDIILLQGKNFFLANKLRTASFDERDKNVGKLCDHILYIKNYDKSSENLIAFKPNDIYKKYFVAHKDDTSYLIPLNSNAEQ